MSRFDAPEYVTRWMADRYTYPAIHNAMADATTRLTAPGERVLDLGCSTGLLGRQMADRGRIVSAMDADGRAMGVGLAAGVFEGIPTMLTRIGPKTVGEAVDWIREQAPGTVMARRIFPELSDALGLDGLAAFASELRRVGVSQIILEGRMPSTRMTHPLCTADLEVKALSGSWRALDAGLPWAHVRVLHPVR
jgi:predicted TPR repeat methyltransferase